MTVNDFRRTMATGEGEKFWKLYGLSSPDELVLEDIAFARGVMVTEGPLDEMEARLIRQGERGLIRVKAGLPETGRKRFAIAHELGHWQLHRDVSQLFACTAEDMVAAYKANPVEAEANYFAAGLLMPTSIFLENVRNREFSFRTLKDLAGLFDTSLTATAIRYVETSNDYVAIIASSGSCVRWWRGSIHFEEQFWVSPRSRLGRNTVADAVATAGGPTRVVGPKEVDLEAWSERRSELGWDTFIEESMYLAGYDQVLTLLRLP